MSDWRIECLNIQHEYDTNKITVRRLAEKHEVSKSYIHNNIKIGRYLRDHKDCDAASRQEVLALMETHEDKPIMMQVRLSNGTHKVRVVNRVNDWVICEAVNFPAPYRLAFKSHQLKEY